MLAFAEWSLAAIKSKLHTSLWQTKVNFFYTTKVKVKVTRSVLRLYRVRARFYCECQHCHSVPNIPPHDAEGHAAQNNLLFTAYRFLITSSDLSRHSGRRPAASASLLWATAGLRPLGHCRGPTLLLCPRETHAVWCTRVQHFHISAAFLAMWEETCCFFICAALFKVL